MTKSVHIIEDQAGSFLCYDQGRWEVDADEFRAWAAYSGIDLSPSDTGGLQVLLRDEAQDLLLRSEWLS